MPDEKTTHYDIGFNEHDFEGGYSCFVSILGEKWLVMFIHGDDDDLQDCDGITSLANRKIKIKLPTEHDDTMHNYTANIRRVLRHEIIHAALYESGLGSNVDWTEELFVDWYAYQFPKLHKLFIELNCAKDV